MNAEKFWSRVDRTEGCWLWTGPTSNGYGKEGQQWAHRIAYTLARGPIATGMQIDHLCRVRPCVNPDHLQVVTQAENLRRGKAQITSCPQGHPYDEANTYRNDMGHRLCRACHRERAGAAHRRRRGEAYKPLRALSQPEIAEAMQMRSAGWTNVQIGRYLGFHSSTILRALARKEAEA